MGGGGGGVGCVWAKAAGGTIGGAGLGGAAVGVIATVGVDGSEEAVIRLGEGGRGGGSVIDLSTS